MSDWNIPDKVARETAYDRADEFAEVQRQAFLAGFQAGIEEADSMAQLREWLESQRDEADRRYQNSDESDDLARKLAFKNTLVKLHEMGCAPDELRSASTDTRHCRLY